MGKELKRMRYFDGLFLNKDDYKLDQDYQRRLLQLHNRYMHTNGIVAGLEIVPSIATINKEIISDPQSKIQLSKVECRVVTEEGVEVYHVPEGYKEPKLCEVVIQEGMALNQVILTDEETKSTESISQQIYICKNHPDSIIDLSGYAVNKDIYLYVDYLEEDTEKELIRGREQFKHVCERGHIGHSDAKPEDEATNIVLGKVTLGLSSRVDTSINGTIDGKDINEIIKRETTLGQVAENNDGIIGKLEKSFDAANNKYLIKFSSGSVQTTETISADIDDVTQEPKSKEIVTIDGDKEKTITITVDTKKIEGVLTTTKKTVDQINQKVDGSDTVLWKLDETIVETTDEINKLHSKKTDCIVTEGNIQKVIAEIAEDIEVEGKKAVKTTGTITVTETVEINDDTTTESVTKEIVTVTNIDNITFSSTDETTGQKKNITTGKNTVTTKDSSTNDSSTDTNQSNTKIIDINIEETIVNSGNQTKSVTISKEIDSEKTKIIRVEKNIVKEEDSRLGIVTKSTTIKTSGQTLEKSGKVVELISTENTEVEKAALNNISVNVEYEKVTTSVKFVQEVSCFDADGIPVKKYSGPGGNELTIQKMVFKNSNESGEMPFIKTLEEDKKIGLEVDSPFTNFTGSVSVKGDLIIKGNLIDNGTGDSSDDSELSISNCYVQVNSKPQTTAVQWKLQNGGLQVYRGETKESPDACLMWSEKRRRWQVGYKYKDENENDIDVGFYDIAYGDKWENLVNRSIADDLHMHSKLYSNSNKIALEINKSGELSINENLSLNDKNIWLRSDGNTNHGLGWFGTGKTFAGIAVDGPVLFGLNGGILGTTENGQKPVITWNSSGNVGIGVKNPTDDKLELGGTLKILSDTNPIRFTSSWTTREAAFSRNAEISNDTTNNKALIIVGNRSAGEERRVAIWDRLDVNGYLYVNGNTQITNAIRPSAGSGLNGIIFPNDPGGGGWDSAWIKYYPQSGEACTLEIGTSNDYNDNISLFASGNVGIGTRDPADKLDVYGNMRVLSGTNPIRFTSAWDGTSSLVNNQAEICNDSTRYKSLILVGNKSSGRRKVSVWDDLDVNGSVTLNGNLNTVCAIVPSVGSGPNNGISFPSEYNGDKGDSAWIRYFSDPLRGGRENMTLEIGIGNDPGDGRYNGAGDRIRLHASGGVYVDGYFYYSSSRELKENITKLSTDKAKMILNGLNPVAFNFIGDTEKTTLGFIAEDVPKEVAAVDQKAISPMEIVAVLTSVVKSQRKLISELQQQVESLL